MTISRMQQPRQQYGLGSFVKKAFKKVKKIAKSPIGKAALLGGLGMYGMGAGPFGSMKGAGFLRGMMGKQLGSKTLGGWANRMFNPWQSGEFSGKHAFGLGAGALMAAPFVQSALKMGPYADEEEVEAEDWSLMPSSISNIVNRAQNYYRSPTPNYADLQFMPEKYLPSGAPLVNPNFYAAEGGRAGLLNGGGAGEAQMEQMLRAEYLKYKNKGGTMPYEQFKMLVMKQAQQGQTPNQMMAANGGRIGYNRGRVVNPGGYAGDDGILSTIKNFPKNLLSGFGQIFSGETGAFLGGDQEKINEILLEKGYGIDLPTETISMIIDMNKKGMGIDEIVTLTGADTETITNIIERLNMKAQGGRIGKQEGGALMDLGGQEKDYRENGGFVPIGEEERADDVPARLSKNEFVFTADAVRAAGGGDIDAGSEVMQNVMDNLEQGGEVSEDSQGLGGGEEIMSEELVEDINPAQGMYDNYEQLQSRVA